MKPRPHLPELGWAQGPLALRWFPNSVDLHSQLGSIQNINSHSPPLSACILLPIVWGETKEFEFLKALPVTGDLASLGSIALVVD